MAGLLKDPMILRQIIMDHYEYPHHHKLVADPAYLNTHMASESCIDDIHVQAKIENGIITPSVGVFYRIINALGMRVEVVQPVY